MMAPGADGGEEGEVAQAAAVDAATSCAHPLRESCTTSCVLDEDPMPSMVKTGGAKVGGGASVDGGGMGADAGADAEHVAGAAAHDVTDGCGGNGDGGGAAAAGAAVAESAVPPAAADAGFV